MRSCFYNLKPGDILVREETGRDSIDLYFKVLNESPDCILLNNGRHFYRKGYQTIHFYSTNIVRIIKKSNIEAAKVEEFFNVDADLKWKL